MCNRRGKSSKNTVLVDQRELKTYTFSFYALSRVTQALESTTSRKEQVFNRNNKKINKNTYCQIGSTEAAK